ncbi:MAG TPA: acyl-CoA dehydrogenase family protein [Roseiflexaceae bacterium]|nr:acyl-CoA dehydrogenase family protein [Roseiflexaceae bacterium]
MYQSFNQPAPTLGNQYDDDRALRSYLRRVLPPELLAEAEPVLRELGALAGDQLYRTQLADRRNEPVLTQWDAWGERIDQIELSPLWRLAERLAAEWGLVATAYDPAYGQHARPYQFALAYLFHPSTDVYTCPLAMTDGAARTLLRSGNQELIGRAVPHLTSRDPEQFWTSGQWMTESTGGSDVGRSETVARQDERGVWRLYGRKWFTSATTSQMALTLARPEGNGPGGSGLALFYVETREPSGRLRNIRVNRLKDKLGTRKVPTAELSLEGAPAVPVAGLSDGVKAIVPMLQVTRTWNSVMAAASMRRGLALARDYARRRIAFGATLDRQPLHVDTIAGLQAEFEAALHLSFFLVELLGASEHGTLSAEEAALLRVLTSIAKLTTGRQVVPLASETLELFGGAGYVEDTGLPLLLRDSQVLPIWEGTTNVLSLDTLRALADSAVWEALGGTAEALVGAAREPLLAEAGNRALAALAHARRWYEQSAGQGRAALERGARRCALTLGRALSLALLVRHAQWSLDHEHDARARAAALRFAQAGVDLLDVAGALPAADEAALANDESLAPPE